MTTIDVTQVPAPAPPVAPLPPAAPLPAPEVKVVADTTSPAPDAPAESAGGELRPIIAPWLKDRREFAAVAGDAVHRLAHAAGWHAVHSPFHVGRFVKYTPRGMYRSARALCRWIFHVEAKPLRQEAVNSSNSPEWRALERERVQRVALRLKTVGIAGGIVLVAVPVWWALAPRWPIGPFVLTPRWTWAMASVVGVGVFGYVGRPLDKARPLIPAATSAYGGVPLTNDVVLDALCSLAIAGMTKPEQITLLYGVKPTRAGYNLDLDLPRGVEATSVMAVRGKLSSALQRGIDTCWPSVGPRHAGHLMLFISHEGMSSARQRQWPLLKAGTVDLFDATEMFTDQRGDWVTLRVATTSGVVGAIPRMGKSYFMRELGLVGALDVRCEEYVFELKGTGDMSALKLVAHYYSDSDEEEDIAEHLEVMKRLKAERRRRTKVIKNLPDERCPRSEVTSELASDPTLGLHPILVIIDECQTWTQHAVKTTRETFIAIIEELVRKGPAVGIWVYLATQKVDAASIPTVISSMASVRLCFKVNDATSNNQILGPGSYANGLQATMFDFEKDKGVAYLKSAGPAEIVRTVSCLDKVEAEKVALRARDARKRVGRLTGHAAGEDFESGQEQEVVLLDDVRAVIGVGDAIHLTDLVSGLAALRPALYGTLDARSLGSQLRAAGVSTSSVYVPGKAAAKRSGTGVKREWLTGGDQP